MLNKEKMISIIMPTYNCADYLDRSISSVLRQTYDNWELLIIDDGSKDNTRNICNYYSSIDKRIKYIYQDNQGVSISRNNGLKYSQGCYICFLDADDSYQPKYLESFLPHIENYDLVCSGFVYKNNSQLLDSTSLDENCNLDLFKSYINSISQQKHPFCICSILLRKSFLLDNKMTFSHRKNGEDTEFIIKVLSKSKSYFIPDRFFYYYQGRHGSATTSNKIGEQILSVLNGYIDVYDYLREDEEKTKLISFLIKKEIIFYLKFLSKKTFRNIKPIYNILTFSYKNRNYLRG